MGITSEQDARTTKTFGLSGVGASRSLAFLLQLISGFDIRFRSVVRDGYTPMNTLAREILKNFDDLPNTEQQAIAVEILKRVINFDFSPLTDEDLVL